MIIIVKQNLLVLLFILQHLYSIISLVVVIYFIFTFFKTEIEQNFFL